MRKQADDTCQRCGFGSTNLEVHHLNYDRFGKERMTDLIVLCKQCHEKADRERVQKREAEFQARCEESRYEAGYHTYMTKKYGEDYVNSEGPCHREEFDDWVRDKWEVGYDD